MKNGKRGHNVKYGHEQEASALIRKIFAFLPVSTFTENHLDASL